MKNQEITITINKITRHQLGPGYRVYDSIDQTYTDFSTISQARPWALGFRSACQKLIPDCAINIVYPSRYIGQA